MCVGGSCSNSIYAQPLYRCFVYMCTCAYTYTCVLGAQRGNQMPWIGITDNRELPSGLRTELRSSGKVVSSLKGLSYLPSPWELPLRELRKVVPWACRDDSLVKGTGYLLFQRAWFNSHSTKLTIIKYTHKVISNPKK